VIDVSWHQDALLHETGSGVFEQPPSLLLAELELHPENAVRLRNMIFERGPSVRAADLVAHDTVLHRDNCEVHQGVYAVVISSRFEPRSGHCRRDPLPTGASFE
jgi:hypothetical protein